MASELQRRFSKSRIARVFLSMGMALEGNPIRRGYRRDLNKTCAKVLEAMPEAQIKCFLLSAIECYDLPEEQRAEAKKLLKLSQTAFTKEQRARLLE